MTEQNEQETNTNEVATEKEPDTSGQIQDAKKDLPGQILAAAREGLNLSLEELSEQLKVPLNVLQDIEADKVSDSLPEAYVRGYIRAYARKVSVDESLVLTKVETTGAIDTSQLEMQSFSRRNKRKALEKRLTIASWIIAFVLVVALVIWWFQDGGFNKLAPVATSTTAEAVEEPQQEPITTVEVLENATQLENQPAVNDIDLSTVAASEEEMNSADETSAPVDTTEIAAETAEPEIDVEASEQTVNEPTQTEAGSESDLQLTPEQQAMVADTGEVDQEGFIRVEMTFEELCYVEVRDITGELVAFGNKAAGYTMNLNAQGPLSVLLGHKQGVSIRVNGQNYDMSHLPTNRVARFELDAPQGQ